MSSRKTSPDKIPAATVPSEDSPEATLRKLANCFGLTYTPKPEQLKTAAASVVDRWAKNPDAVIALAFRKRGIIRYLTALQAFEEGDHLLTGCAFLKAVHEEAAPRARRSRALNDALIILGSIIPDDPTPARAATA